MNIQARLALLVTLALLNACGQQAEEPGPAPAAETVAPQAAAGPAVDGTVMPATTASDEAMQHYMAGWASWDVNRLNEANDHFTNAASADPEFAMAHLMTALSAQSTRGFTDNLAKASAAKANATRGEQLLVEAFEAALTGDQAGQVAALRQVTELHADSPRAWALLGFALGNNLNDAEGARNAFSKATELDPTLVGPHLNLGNTYVFLEPKDYEKAEMHIAAAIELAPDEPNCHDSMGDVHRAQGNFEAAYADYTRAAELAPTMGSPLQQRGHVNSFMGNYDEARADYTRSAELEDARGTNAGPFFLVFRAYVNLHEGDPDAAMTELRELGEKADTLEMEGMVDLKINTLNNIALIATHYGKADAANTAIAEMAVAMRAQADEVGTAGFRDALEATIAYMEGMLAARMGDTEGVAAKAAEFERHAASNTSPRKLERMHEILGMSAYYQDDFVTAVEQLSQGDHLNNMYIKYHLALANEKAGNTDAARQAFSELAVWNFNGPGYAMTRKDILAKASAG